VEQLLPRTQFLIPQQVFAKEPGKVAHCKADPVEVKT
jgi:hypothetical protein